MKWPTLFRAIREPPPVTTSVALPRTRLALYLFTLTTSLISATLFLISMVYYAVNGQRQQPTLDVQWMHLTLLTLFCHLIWSASWSCIAMRAILKALHSESSDTAKRNKRQCCGCTCTRFHSTTHGVQPVATLVMDLTLWSFLIAIGFVIFAVATNIMPYATTMELSSCYSTYEDEDTAFYCTAAWRHAAALDTAAAFALILCAVGHLLLSVVDCIVVLRWRGDKAGTSADGVATKRRNGTGRAQAAVVPDVEAARLFQLAARPGRTAS